MSTEQGHPIKVAVHRSGLSAHVIRIWEKRYSAVSPRRTPTNRRLYSDADIERLLLLHKASRAGHSISHIANLPVERLVDLVMADEAAAPPPSSSRTRQADDTLPTRPHLEACLAAVEQLNAHDLEEALLRARVGLSQPVFLEQVIVPLMQNIGNLWRQGTLRVMHEHLASAVVRTILGGLLESITYVPPSAPTIVVTTPVGQLHEIGAIVVATIAAAEGWLVTYLGVNLPAEDIAAAVQQQHARAVALSLVHPADDPHLEHELTLLRRYLTPDVGLIVGGRAVEGYHKVLEAIGAVRVEDMAGFRAHLETLRTGKRVS